MCNRLMFLAGVGLFSFACLVAAQQPEPYCSEVSIVDRTPSGSPVLSSGAVKLCEREEGKQLLFWHEGEMRLHNRSTKSALAMVVKVDVEFTHGERTPHRIQTDDFLGDVSMRPGRTKAYPLKSGVTTIPLPNLGFSNPSASSTVVFVEFEDGMFFGDPSEAQDLFDFRTRLLEALRAADKAYTEEGEGAFLAALHESGGRVEVDNYLGSLIEMQKEAGTGRVLERIRTALATAANRPQSLVAR